MAAPTLRQTPRNMGSELPALTTVFRDWGGVNVQSPRQSIRDDQFAWAENVFPIAPGNMPVINAPLATGLNYGTSSAVVYAQTANISGVDYVFTFFANGSAQYSILAGTTGTSFAAAGTFTIPVATPYSSTTGVQGLLILDPVKGYFDFGVTAALTLTALNNPASTLTATSGISPATTFRTSDIYGVTFTPAPTSGPTITVSVTLQTVALVVGGSGYTVGDLVSFPSPISTGGTPLTVQVTAVSGGVVTTFTVATAGSYTLPLGTASTQFLASGGTGSGLTLSFGFASVAVSVTTGGSGFTTGATATFSATRSAISLPVQTFSIANSGLITGVSIAVYAGRVWIAKGRVVSFTDISSYNSFGGAGGSFTINDAYLHNSITALFSSNGYLYVFGDDCIDTVSNVTISAANTTSFSRTNLTTSVGTTYPNSITPYYRSIMFASSNGIYALSGATPQKISEDLDGLFAPSVFQGNLVAGLVTLFGNLCVCWALRITDVFTTLYGANVTRTIFVIFCKGKWFFGYPGFDVSFTVTLPVSGSPVLYGFQSATGVFYNLQGSAAASLLSYWQTKLWDAGDALLDKQVLRAALGLTITGTSNRTVTVTTDSEYAATAVPAIGSIPITGLTFINNTSGVLQFQNNSLQNLYFFNNGTAYAFTDGTASTGGGKYYGMSVTARQTGIVFELAALDVRATRTW